MRAALVDAASQIEVNLPGLGKVMLTGRQMKGIRRKVEQGKIKLVGSEPEV
jgi:hypothetical protein